MSPTRMDKDPKEKPRPIIRILRVRDAAIYLGLTKSKMDKLRIDGGGPVFVRLGSRAVGYDIRDLDDWIDRQKHSSTSDEHSVAPVVVRRKRGRPPKAKEKGDDVTLKRDVRRPVPLS